MESIPLKNTQRIKHLQQWLRTACGMNDVILSPLPKHASFRQYYRLQTANGPRIAVDAPPPQENCLQFAMIAKLLRTHGLHAPQIFAADAENGFLLISDFGNLTLLDALDFQNADRLYERALQALKVFQSLQPQGELKIPRFTAELMQKEWQWQQEWFLNKLLNLYPKASEQAMLNDAYAYLIDAALAQPQVFMHRDFHSANLMLLPQEEIGIIDFQDAFIGPITYDLVSLLRDCYIQWDDERVTNLALTYWHSLQIEQGILAEVDPHDFLKWFDLMGMQRHLKALFTFARKHLRDGQTHYLQHIPRTLNYILKVSESHSKFHAFHDYYFKQVLPRVETRLPACEL